MKVSLDVFIDYLLRVDDCRRKLRERLDLLNQQKNRIQKELDIIYSNHPIRSGDDMKN